MHSAILRSLHSCLAIDFFKFEGFPRPKTGAEGSVRGFFGTVLLLAIFIAFAIQNFISFLNLPYTVTVLRAPTNPATAIGLPPTCISVPHLNDPLYFSYSFQHVQKFPNGTKTKTPIDIDLGADELQSSFCVSARESANAGQLRGFCAPGDCEYVQLRLWTCGSHAKENPTANWTNCSGQAAHILEKHYVTSTYTTIVGNTRLNMAPKIMSGSLYTTTFAHNYTTKSPNFVQSFKEETWTNVMPVSNTYALEYFFEDKKPTSPVLELRVILASYTLTTVETHDTIFDEIGRFGAFWNVIVAVLGMFFLHVNETGFFERHPLWQRIDKDFQIVPLESHVSAKKAAVLRFQQAAMFRNGDIVAPHAMSQDYLKESAAEMTYGAIPR